MSWATDEAWPLRMTTLPPEDKAKWMRRDPGRYFRQCWLERIPEAQAEMRRRLDELAAERRRDGAS